MKVPVLEAPKVDSRPVGTPYENTNFDTGHEQVTQGLNQLGAGLGSAEQSYQRAKKEADDFRVDDAYLKMGRGVNDGLHHKDYGFLNQLGEKALDEQPTLESFNKLQQSISKGLSNDEQRRRFGVRAQALVDQATGSIESHVAQQRMKVYGEVADGAVGLALDTAALNYADGPAANAAIGKVLVGPDGEPGPLRRYLSAQGLPMEKIEAAEHAFIGQAAEVRIEKFLGAEDWKGAQSVFDESKAVLGKRSAQLQHQITEKRKGWEKDQVKAQNEVDVSKAVEAARLPDGFIDENKALAELAKAPPERADALRSVMGEQLKVQAEQKKNTIEEWSNVALSLYNQGGIKAIPSELYDRLNSYDPKFIRSLQAEEEAKKSKSQSDQTQRYTEALRMMMGRPQEDRAVMNVEKEFLGMGLNNSSVAGLKAQQQRDIDGVRKGQAVHESDFVTQARAKVEGSLEGKEDVKAFDAEARLAYGQAVTENKGQPPSREQAEAALKALIKKRVTTTPRRFFGIDLGTSTKEEPEFRARAEERAKQLEHPAPEPPPPVNGPTPLLDQGPTVVEERPAKGGGVLQKMSDGSVRRKP